MVEVVVDVMGVFTPREVRGKGRAVAAAELVLPGGHVGRVYVVGAAAEGGVVVMVLEHEVAYGLAGNFASF